MRNGYALCTPDGLAAIGRLLSGGPVATLLAAVEQHRHGGPNTVLLTRLGGGLSGNDGAWIDDAIERALHAVATCGLDVRLVSYGGIDPAMARIARRWAGRGPHPGAA